MTEELIYVRYLDREYEPMQFDLMTFEEYAILRDSGENITQCFPRSQDDVI